MILSCWTLGPPSCSALQEIGCLCTSECLGSWGLGFSEAAPAALLVARWPYIAPQQRAFR